MPPSPVDLLAALEARLAELMAHARAGHPDNLRDFQADIATPAVANSLQEELQRHTQQLQTHSVTPEGWARLQRIEDLAKTVALIAFRATLPIGEAFTAILHQAHDARRTFRPNDIDPRRDRITAVMDAKAMLYRLPTRPGPFTIGGPGADVVISGLVGIHASGEVLPDGRMRVTNLEGRHIGRNEPCPCGSGRKHKRCCLN
jgi:hypothetical protein